MVVRRRHGRARRRLSLLRRNLRARKRRSRLESGFQASDTAPLPPSSCSSLCVADPVQLPTPSQQREPLTVPVPEGCLEVSRDLIGLRLVGGNVLPLEDGSTSDWTKTSGGWEYPVMDERRRCFVGIRRGALDEKMRARLWNVVHSGVPWEQPMQTWGPMPRKTAWMSESPCSCNYGYGGMQIKPIPFPAWMHELMQLLMPLCGLRSREEWPNSCNLNLYEKGDHSVSFHADNEKIFNGKFQDCPILSLSLGQERCFEIKAPPIAEGEQKTHVKLNLKDGDLCSMEGLCQKYYQHAVLRENKKVDARINITWRWLVEHFSECPLHAAEKRIMPYGGGKAATGSAFGSKGKGKGKGKGKDKGKDGKGKGKGGGKSKDKGKSKSMGRGMVRPTIQKH